MGQAEDISSKNENQVEGGILDFRGHVLLLGLLEIQLREDMEPVGDLDDEEELEEEGHVVVRIAIPEVGDIEEILLEDDVPSPDERDEVKTKENLFNIANLW